MIFKYKDIWTRKNERRDGEESPIGLILCSEGNTEHIEYLMLEEDSPIKVHSIIQNCRTRSFFQKNCSELSLLQRSGIRRSCLTRKTTNDDIIASAHSTSGPNCGCAFEDYFPPPISHFQRWLGESFFPSSKAQNFYHFVNQFVRACSYN